MEREPKQTIFKCKLLTMPSARECGTMWKIEYFCLSFDAVFGSSKVQRLREREREGDAYALRYSQNKQMFICEMLGLFINPASITIHHPKKGKFVSVLSGNHMK